MVATWAEVEAGWESLIEDPAGFIEQLSIEDQKNRLGHLSEMWPEQVEWLHALLTSRLILGLKPRQVGFTTVTCAFLFWKAYTSSRGRRVVQVVHEKAALARMARMTRIMWRELPLEFQSPLETDSREEIGFSHNGAAIQRILAGGRSQGRAYTITDVHATEMGKWPRGTSAQESEEGEDADAEAFASLMAAVHDEDGHCIVESTGNGPRGLFYELHQEASRKWKPGDDGEPSEWRYVFVSWLDVPRYRRPIRDLGLFMATLDEEELALIEHYNAEPEQLAWRRWKMRTLRMSALRFRREFPTNPHDPFSRIKRGWFNGDILGSQLKECLDLQATEDGVYVPFLPFEPHRNYYMGVDPSGGTGGDEAAIQILRDDMAHVGIWASRWTSPLGQARWVSKLGTMHGGRERCKAMIESNLHGKQVLKHVRQLGGVALWTRPDGSGKDWVTTHDSKRELFTHAREEIDEDWTWTKDAETLRQLMSIVERPDGTLGAAGSVGSDEEHDDRAFAKCLALYCGRGRWRRDKVTKDTARERIRAILRRGGRLAHRRQRG